MRMGWLVPYRWWLVLAVLAILLFARWGRSAPAPFARPTRQAVGVSPCGYWLAQEMYGLPLAEMFVHKDGWCMHRYERDGATARFGVWESDSEGRCITVRFNDFNGNLTDNVYFWMNKGGDDSYKSSAMMTGNVRTYYRLGPMPVTR